jgi:hypothetical protein
MDKRGAEHRPRNVISLQDTERSVDVQIHNHHNYQVN